MSSSSQQIKSSSGAAFAICPEEVLAKIVSYLEGTNLKRCRLISQQLHRIVTPALFARLYIDCYHFELLDVVEFATQVHLAARVQEIVFDI